MGVDIAAWIEVKPSYFEAADPDPFFREWITAVRAGLLIERNYEAFGCLFGVNNRGNFIPVAGWRGLPAGVSAAVHRDHEGYQEAFGESWLTWAEIAAIDWEEYAPHPHGYLHRYVRDSKGNLVADGLESWSKRFGELRTVVIPEGYPGIQQPTLVPPEGEIWEFDGVEYRAEKLRRREALSEDWWGLFVIMKTLANHFGAEGVRLVVWFSW